MNNRKNDIKSLLQRYLKGNSTDIERKSIEQWYSYTAKQQANPANNLDYEEIQKQSLSEILHKKDDLQKGSGFRSIKYWLPSAAALLLCVLGLLWFKSDNRNTLPQEVSISEITSGDTRATLTFENGKKLILNNHKEGIEVRDNIIYADGSKITDDEQNFDQIKQQNLVLSIPPGGTYQVRLSDGTQVWLNAGSLLRYPVTFADNERTVELEGEAYFDVKKQRTKAGQNRPFKVLTKGQEIHVLGTVFNVNAYMDQIEERTVLLEGIVQINAKNSATNSSTVLTPGKQSTITKKGITISNADIFATTAWRNGRFSFDGKPFSEIMAELSRWYNFDIKYVNGIPDVQFIGGAHRTEDISTALKVIESANISYRAEKNSNGKYTLIITNKKKEVATR